MPAVFNVDHQRDVQTVADHIDDRLVQIGPNQRSDAGDPQHDVLVPADIVRGLGDLVETEIKPLDLPEKLRRLGRRHETGPDPLEQPDPDDFLQVANEAASAAAVMPPVIITLLKASTCRGFNRIRFGSHNIRA